MVSALNSTTAWWALTLDHVVAEDSTASAEAVEIVAMLNSYTEYSPSGKGLHILLRVISLMVEERLY